MWIPESRQLVSAGKRHPQNGTAAVEFIVALPFLLLMLLAVAEFGQALFQYNTLTKSTRDAARHLSQNVVNGSTDTVRIEASDITETKNLVVFGNIVGSGSALLPGFSVSDVTVSCLGGGTNCPGAEYIQISAQYSYLPIIGSTLPTFGLTASDIPLNLTLSTSVVMRAL